MLYIIVGPSGSGKTTLIKLAVEVKRNIKVIKVDVCSASNRVYEEGVGRNSVTESYFAAKLRDGYYNHTYEYLDNKYGFSLPLEYTCENVVYLLDYPGDYPECVELKKYKWKGILVLPPDVFTLRKRLIKCNRLERIESAEKEYYECLEDITQKKFGDLWVILFNDKYSDIYHMVKDL